MHFVRSLRMNKIETDCLSDVRVADCFTGTTIYIGSNRYTCSSDPAFCDRSTRQPLPFYARYLAIIRSTSSQFICELYIWRCDLLIPPDSLYAWMVAPDRSCQVSHS